MQINTSAITVENDRIHLYFQREYTIIPANGRKNEYHNLVSPMVRNGGRSSDIHISTIKLKNTSSPAPVAPKATPFLSFHAAHAPTAHSSTATTAKYINSSQVTITFHSSLFTPHSSLFCRRQRGISLHLSSYKFPHTPAATTGRSPVPESTFCSWAPC